MPRPAVVLDRATKLTGSEDFRDRLIRMTDEEIRQGIHAGEFNVFGRSLALQELAVRGLYSRADGLYSQAEAERLEDEERAGAKAAEEARRWGAQHQLAERQTIAAERASAAAERQTNYASRTLEYLIGRGWWVTVIGLVFAAFGILVAVLKG